MERDGMNSPSSSNQIAYEESNIELENREIVEFIEGVELRREQVRKRRKVLRR